MAPEEDQPCVLSHETHLACDEQLLGSPTMAAVCHRVIFESTDAMRAVSSGWPRVPDAPTKRPGARSEVMVVIRLLQITVDTMGTCIHQWKLLIVTQDVIKESGANNTGSDRHPIVYTSVV